MDNKEKFKELIGSSLASIDSYMEEENSTCIEGGIDTHDPIDSGVAFDIAWDTIFSNMEEDTVSVFLGRLEFTQNTLRDFLEIYTNLRANIDLDDDGARH